MRRWFLALVAMLVLMAREAPAQQAETRIALIIANESYVSPSLGRLPGTQRDAALMEQALRSAGFQVTVARNVNRTQMRDAIMGFARRLGQLGQNGVGFFYYSGHGIADDPRGRNYLVPVDAQVSGVTDLPIVALSLNDQLDAIELAHARATVIVIDACRNTPISFGRGGRGLAPVSAMTDTLIAFSTQPGEIAADDGVYARVLSEELVRPGVRISQAFDTVQARVSETTQRRQRPRYDNGLVVPIVFVAPIATPSAPITSAAAPSATSPTTPASTQTAHTPTPSATSVDVQQFLTPTALAFFNQETERAARYFRPYTLSRTMRMEMSIVSTGIRSSDRNRYCQFSSLPTSLIRAGFASVTDETTQITARSPFLRTETYSRVRHDCLQSAPDPTENWEATRLEFGIPFQQQEDHLSRGAERDVTGEINVDVTQSALRSMRVSIVAPGSPGREVACTETRRWQPREWNPAWPFHIVAMNCRGTRGEDQETFQIYLTPELMLGLPFVGPSRAEGTYFWSTGPATETFTPSNVQVRSEGGALRVSYDTEETLVWDPAGDEPQTTQHRRYRQDWTIRLLQ